MFVYVCFVLIILLQIVLIFQNSSAIGFIDDCLDVLKEINERKKAEEAAKRQHAGNKAYKLYFGDNDD